MPAIGGVCNPRSVIEALEEGVCKDYWSKTGGFSELEEYITIDFDGLGQTVTDLVAGSSVAIDVLGFSNDIDNFHDKDEVLTALVHLAFYASADDYILKFEGSAVKGYADCLMLPRRPGIPGIIVELKYGSSADTFQRLFKGN